MRQAFLRLLVSLVLLSTVLPCALPAQAQTTDVQEQMRQAQELVLQKRYISARQAFAALLRDGRTSGDQAVKAYAYYGQGFCALQLWEFSNARDNLERSLQIYTELGSLPDQARVQYQLGQVKQYYNLAGGPRAHYIQVVAIARQVGDLQSEAQALAAIGALQISGSILAPDTPLATLDAQIPSTQKALQQAIDIQRAHGFDADLSDSLEAIANYAKDTTQLRSWVGEALAAARRSGDSDRIIRRLNLSALVALSSGEPDQALSAADESIRLGEQYGDPERLADALGTAATVYTYQRQYQDALAFLTRAREAAIQSDTPSDNDAVTLQMADIYQRVGQYDRAVPPLEELLDMFRQRSYILGQGDVLAELAALAHAQGKYADAERLMRDAIALNGHVTSRASALLTFADTLVTQGKHEMAEQVLAEALGIAQRTKDQLLLAETYITFARLKNAQSGSAAEVEVLYQRAQEYARNSRDLGKQYRVMVETGAYYEQRGDRNSALQSYRAAITLRDAFQSALGVEEFRRDAAVISADLYERVFLLTVATDVATAFEMSERARARVLLDQLSGAHADLRASGDPALLAREKELVNAIRALTLQLEQTRTDIASLASVSEVSTTPEAEKQKAREERERQLADLIKQSEQMTHELGDRQQEYEKLTVDLKLISPKYISVKSGQPLSLAEVQRFLNSQTTLIAYYIAGNTTYAFTITQRSASVKKLAVADINKKVIDTVKAIKGQSAGRAIASLSVDLISPVLKDITTPVIGIIPYGSLHYVPFAALLAGEKRLGEQYMLFDLPSASVLGYLHASTASPLRAPLLMAEGRVRAGWNALPGADQEVKDIGNILGAETLTAADATVDAFFKRAPDASLIHLAMHADFKPEAPLFSQLLFAQQKAPLELREIYSLDLQRTDIVVLSACETQLGNNSGGDEISSLNRAFMYAGASTVIASLWKVDDRATNLLMRHFYQALKQDAGPAQALQLAQAAVRTDPEFVAPFYWSGFILTGAPGAIKQGVTIVAEPLPTALPSAPPPTLEPAQGVGDRSPIESGGQFWLFGFLGIGVLLVVVVGLLWLRRRLF